MTPDEQAHALLAKHLWSLHSTEKSAIAAIKEALGYVPKGWKLVPVEPTTEMLDGYWKATGESKEMRSRTHSYGTRYYAAMISAAPQMKETK